MVVHTFLFMLIKYIKSEDCNAVCTSSRGGSSFMGGGSGFSGGFVPQVPAVPMAPMVQPTPICNCAMGGMGGFNPGTLVPMPPSYPGVPSQGLPPTISQPPVQPREPPQPIIETTVVKEKPKEVCSQAVFNQCETIEGAERTITNIRGGGTPTGGSPFTPYPGTMPPQVPTIPVAPVAPAPIAMVPTPSVSTPFYGFGTPSSSAACEMNCPAPVPEKVVNITPPTPIQPPQQLPPSYSTSRSVGGGSSTFNNCTCEMPNNSVGMASGASNMSLQPSESACALKQQARGGGQECLTGGLLTETIGGMEVPTFASRQVNTGSSGMTCTC